MRKLLCLLVLSLAIVLGGCTNDTAEPTVTDPTHIYDEVREDFRIDADVVSFPGDGFVTIYEATPRKLTQEQINDFLSSNGDAVVEWTNLLNPDRYFGYTADTLLNGFFRHSVSKSNMEPGNMDYRNPRFERWDNAQIYFGQEHSDNSAQYSFGHLFTEPRDFNFATASEAMEAVLQQLSDLGFVNLIHHRTLYVDHDVLANTVTPKLRTDEWQSLFPEGLVTYDDWSEADDGYIFEFFTGVDEIPLAYHSFINDTYFYNGSSVLVWYQSSGIIYLNAPTSLWSLGDPVETVSRLIPATEALSIARIKLENTKVYTNTTINKISGEYIYTPDGDNFQLRPVWVVYATTESTITGATTTNRVVIDAITGDELM